MVFNPSQKGDVSNGLNLALIKMRCGVANKKGDEPLFKEIYSLIFLQLGLSPL